MSLTIWKKCLHCRGEYDGCTHCMSGDALICDSCGKQLDTRDMSPEAITAWAEEASKNLDRCESCRTYWNEHDAAADTERAPILDHESSGGLFVDKHNPCFPCRGKGRVKKSYGIGSRFEDCAFCGGEGESRASTWDGISETLDEESECA